MPENFEMQADFSIFVRMDRGEIIIYRTADGETRLEVRMESDSVWLTQAQIARLFGVDRTVIVRHVNNIYKSCELEREATCAKIAHVQHEGLRQVRRMIPYYNLNNQAKAEQLEELKKTVRLLSHVLAAKEVTKSEAVGLLRVITDYTYGLDTLDRYDYQQLEVSATTSEEPFRATYENAMAALQVLRDKFGGSALFAREKDESFKSTMGAIYQTFGGRDLYPSVEEKAANLLYLTVKNHSFSDGNKRIAAFLFLWFLENNRILYRPDGSRLLDNNTLVALTLMIAESRTEEKDVMTKVVVNLINKNN